jgi:methyl-accepting chemotaxis protein
MRVPIGYKFIFGFIIVVATTAFIPSLIGSIGYSQEITNILTYSVAMTVGLVLGWIFSRQFTGNIARLTEAAEAISNGDLTLDVNLPESRFPDETQDLENSINRMVDNLRNLVNQIRLTAEKVSESAGTLSSSALEVNASNEEVAQAIEQISRGAETQAEMVEKSSRGIHEMAISIEIVAKRANEAAKAARDTSVTAQRGSDLAGKSLDSMKNLFNNVELSGRQFMDFIAKLQQVGKIADVIGEIARQTNLLALNAAIEAARAGEYGKGFAVVADEVGKLADSTAKSAAEISDLITTVKEEGRRTQETLAESFKHINNGKQSIDTTAASFQDILQTVLETERKATSIADLSQMQTDGANKMVGAIDEISKVADDNAAATEEVSAATEEQAAAMQEMASASQDMARLAEELLQFVSSFKINEETEPVL